MTRTEALTKAKELGIEHDKRIPTKKLIETLNKITGENYEADQPTEAPVESKEEDPNRTIRCIIHSGDRENDVESWDGSVNGEVFQFPIGIETDLPVKYLPSLNDAVIKEHIAVFDDNGHPTKEVKIRYHKRFIVERI